MLARHNFKLAKGRVVLEGVGAPVIERPVVNYN